MAQQHLQQQFESQLQANCKIVFKVARIYAWTREDRRELEQEIAAQLWRAFPAYDQTRKFSTWMYRIALNVGISYARKESGRQSRFEPLDAELADRVADSPDSAAADDRLPLLQAFISQLDELNRALILLYLEERSTAEIADILGISQTNVSTKLNRIKQRLRTQMSAAEPTPTGAR